MAVPKENLVYKIRRVADGKFSNGGTTPNFNDRGKIWKQKGHLTNHLNQLDRMGRERYLGCEIVHYKVVEQEVSFMSIDGYLLERQRKLDEEAQRRQNYRDKLDKEKRRVMYEDLKKEFENEETEAECPQCGVAGDEHQDYCPHGDR